MSALLGGGAALRAAGRWPSLVRPTDRTFYRSVAAASVPVLTRASAYDALGWASETLGIPLVGVKWIAPCLPGEADLSHEIAIEGCTVAGQIFVQAAMEWPLAGHVVAHEVQHRADQWAGRFPSEEDAERLATRYCRERQPDAHRCWDGRRVTR